MKSKETKEKKLTELPNVRMIKNTELDTNTELDAKQTTKPPRQLANSTGKSKRRMR